VEARAFYGKDPANHTGHELCGAACGGRGEAATAILEDAADNPKKFRRTAPLAPLDARWRDTKSTIARGPREGLGR
jgi:hypothetical protein